MMIGRRTNNANPRRGLVLVIVLVVIAFLTLASLTFSEWMFTERRAATLSVRQAQARASADSGVEMARVVLALDADARQEAGGIYDNQQLFRGMLVADDSDAKMRSRFTLVSPNVDQSASSPIRYGLEDESARLNLDTLLTADKSEKGSGRKILMGLPGMTEQIADAILDWLDADSQPREYGAEVEYYSTLLPPYAPKNAAFTTVEELLLVRGVTPSLLYGCDLNRDGIVDARESGSAAMSGVDNSDGSMDRGWSAYLTLHSLERNVRPSGEAKININQDDMQTLYDALQQALGNADWAAFIVAYRQNGPYSGTKPGEASGSRQMDLKKKGTAKCKTVLDLIDAKVQLQFPNEKNPVILESPFKNAPGTMDTWLPTLMDNLTVNTAKTIPGRINVNQAPKTVLLTVPGMTSQIVDAILSKRTPNPTSEQPGRRYETWLLAEGIVKLDEMKALMPYMNAGGAVFRCQSVGYADGEGPVARIEAVIDASGSTPKMIFYRDLTHLGRSQALRDLLGGGTGQ